MTADTASLIISTCWVHARSVLQSYIHNISSFSTIKSFISTCVQDPSQFITYYKDTDPLETALYYATALSVIHYILAEVTRNYSQVDRSWSFTPVVYAWHFAIHDRLIHGSFHPRLLTAAIIISIWGARLTYNFARKGGYYFSGEDYRFTWLKENIGTLNMELLNLIFIAPMQNLLLLLIVAPLSFTNYLNADIRTMSAFDIGLAGLFLSLFFIEAVADEQQYFFQTEKHALLKYLSKNDLKGDYKLGFLWHSGLFQYSRHPNFFAEQSMWWVIYLFSVSAVQDKSGSNELSTWFNWSICAPIFLTLLFQGSTELTERLSAGKYPEYKQYSKSVSKFLPWFPSSPKRPDDKKEL